MANENVEQVAIAQLGQYARDHEKGDGEEGHCFGHRCELVARLMIELDLGLTEIGYIADTLIEIECEESEAPAETQAEDDSVLDAKELELR